VRVLGTSELKAVELPGELQFVYGYQAGWGDLAAPPATLLVLLAWAWSTHRPVFAAIFVVAFTALVVYWLNISPTRLSVSSQELIAHGNQNRNIREEVIVPASEVKSIGYLAAGEHGAAGLYAFRGNRQTCLMPGLTQEQATAIADVIREKFPYLERGGNTQTSLEFGEQNKAGYISHTGIPSSPAPPAPPEA